MTIQLPVTSRMPGVTTQYAGVSPRGPASSAQHLLGQEVAEQLLVERQLRQLPVRGGAVEQRDLVRAGGRQYHEPRDLLQHLQIAVNKDPA